MITIIQLKNALEVSRRVKDASRVMSIIDKLCPSLIAMMKSKVDNGCSVLDHTQKAIQYGIDNGYTVWQLVLCFLHDFGKLLCDDDRVSMYNRHISLLDLGSFVNLCGTSYDEYNEIGFICKCNTFRVNLLGSYKRYCVENAPKHWKEDLLKVSTADFCSGDYVDFDISVLNKHTKYMLSIIK